MGKNCQKSRSWLLEKWVKWVATLLFLSVVPQGHASPHRPWLCEQSAEKVDPVRERSPAFTVPSEQHEGLVRLGGDFSVSTAEAINPEELAQIVEYERITGGGEWYAPGLEFPNIQAAFHSFLTGGKFGGPNKRTVAILTTVLVETSPGVKVKRLKALVGYVEDVSPLMLSGSESPWVLRVVTRDATIPVSVRELRRLRVRKYPAIVNPTVSEDPASAVPVGAGLRAAVNAAELHELRVELETALGSGITTFNETSKGKKWVPISESELLSSQNQEVCGIEWYENSGRLVGFRPVVGVVTGFTEFSHDHIGFAAKSPDTGRETSVLLRDSEGGIRQFPIRAFNMVHRLQ